MTKITQETYEVYQALCKAQSSLNIKQERYAYIKITKVIDVLYQRLEEAGFFTGDLADDLNQ